MLEMLRLRCVHSRLYIMIFYLTASHTATVQAQDIRADNQSTRTVKVAEIVKSIDFEGKPFTGGLRFSSDGKKIWTDRFEGWSVPKGQRLPGEAPSGLQGPFAFDFSIPQEKRLIVDKRSGKALIGSIKENGFRERVLRQDGPVIAARFIEDGKRFMLLFSNPPSAYIGDPGSPRNDEVVRLPHKARRGVIARSGKLIATNNDREVQLWDVKEKTVHRTLQHTERVFSVAVSPDERWVATGASDNIIRLFDAKTGKLEAMLKGHTEGQIFLPSAVWSLAFSPDGRRLVSGGHDGRVIVWDTNTKRASYKMQVHDSPIIVSVTFSTDSELVACSFEGAGPKRGIRIWKL